ncbi:MAG: carboxypeptidase M32 [Anaerolineae bacterium]|nr:carboxypeptidase M32 [Anaerolineae bacterium]
MNAQFEELIARLGEIADFNNAAGVLSWDQQTYMPPGAIRARAQQLTTLRRTAHERFTSDEIGQLLDDLEPQVAELEPGSYEASLIRVTRRDYDRQRKLSADLVARLTRTTALAREAWERARKASDFALFLPHLDEILDLSVEIAEALGYEDRIYDALLDRFEPGLKTARIEALFAEMKAGLVPLGQAIAGQQGRADDTFLHQDFPVDRQWDFGLEVITRLGFDFEHGRQDRSAHPFTTSFTPADVRLTTRLSPGNFKSALFGSIHEAGHGMYNQGIPMDLARTPLARGASLGVHESQSRMWENIVGRSRGFWTFWLPRLREYFPSQLEGVTVDAFYRAVNRVEPSLIRVEADEVTYNLHIFVRFEIENLMLERKVRLSDLPELWKTKMEEYLGVWPADDADGVLQDVHWSSGMLGYFPTYSLGNILSAQFYDQAVSEIPDIPAQIEKGEFGSLLGWMRTNIHARGAKYTPAELVELVTGGPIRTEPFLDYARSKYAEIYGL